MRQLLRIIAGNRFLEGLLLYNIAIFCIFVAVYHGIDFAKHFDLPPGEKTTTQLIAYYTFLSQANVMAGEIVPKTNTGRTILATHIFMSWGIMVAFLVPWPTSA